VSFTTAQVSTVAKFLYPAQGEAIDLSKPFQWTIVPNAQAYYLYVGTTPGSKNLIDTGEISSTSFKAFLLPAGPTLYARIYTKINNTWQFSDVSFRVTGSGFMYPTNGDLNVNRTKYFFWTAISNAQAYYLYVGTSPGAKDIIDSGETQANSYGMQRVPAGVDLYAIIWTKLPNGAWIPSSTVKFRAN
jgi:hypothetical protein